MFRRLAGDTRPIVLLEFEGRRIEAREGEPLAAALLAGGVAAFRSTPVTGAARGPYCLMGVCFDCLVEVDGEPNRQACMVRVADGMRVRRQQGARPPGPTAGGAA